MAKVRFLFVSSDMGLIDPLQTYSCDFGHNMIFSHYYQLRKHKFMHEDADRYRYLDNTTVSNLTTINKVIILGVAKVQLLHVGSKGSRGSLRDTVSLPFTTLSLKTGMLTSLPYSSGMIHGHPDAIKVHSPSKLVNRDCNYNMYDRSLVRKHRVRVRRYVPYPRASSKDTGTFEFVFSSTPSPRAVTSNATSSQNAFSDARTCHDCGSMKSKSTTETAASLR